MCAKDAAKVERHARARAYNEIDSVYFLTEFLGKLMKFMSLVPRWARLEIPILWRPHRLFLLSAFVRLSERYIEKARTVIRDGKF